MTYNMKIACISFTVFALSSLQLGFAQSPKPTATPLSCSGFTKISNGHWYAKPDNPAFDMGDVRQKTVVKEHLFPKSHYIGGQDLYAAVEATCGKH